MKNKNYEKPTLEMIYFMIEDVITVSVDADYAGAKGVFDSNWLIPSYNSGADYSGSKGKFDPLW